MVAENENPKDAEQPPVVVKPMAVIELGATSIRMVVAQAGNDGRFTILDSLQQAVSLGKDTFVEGMISRDTTEECVKALRSFRKVLREYQVVDSRRVVAIATSAVREAANQEAFLDRIFIATGIDVAAIDEGEVHRFVYLAVHPLLAEDPQLKEPDVMVVEVGGGTTEVLKLKDGLVCGAFTHRLGSLRLIKALEDSRSPAVRLRAIMRNYIDQGVSQIVQNVNYSTAPHLLLLGGDVRFAASQLLPKWDKQGITRLPVPLLSKFADELLALSAEKIVKKYHVSFTDAESLGPALLIAVCLAQALKLKTVFVGDATLRSGVLCEMAAPGAWTQEFKQQIVNAAIELGRRYDFNQSHAANVAHFARQLFAALVTEHHLNPRHELVLTVAAWLHDIGSYVHVGAHHKHSMYLILNSDLFGLGARDQALAALVARYHRKALPKADHEIYSTLDKEQRVGVAQMAAILRVADALDRSYFPHSRDVKIQLADGRMTILMSGGGDLTLEQYALQQKADMFEQVFGLKVELKAD